jgi:hypothetical protein
MFRWLQVSGNNYKLIFLLAASITVASTVAFVTFVPAHARPANVSSQAQQSSKQQLVSTASGPGRPLAGGQAAAGIGTAHAELHGPEEQQKQGLGLGKLMRDVASMGPGFYRTLLVIGMYGMGHINEVRQTTVETCTAHTLHELLGCSPTSELCDNFFWRAVFVVVASPIFTLILSLAAPCFCAVHAGGPRHRGWLWQGREHAGRGAAGAGCVPVCVATGPPG